MTLASWKLGRLILNGSVWLVALTGAVQITINDSKIGFLYLLALILATFGYILVLPHVRRLVEDNQRKQHNIELVRKFEGWLRVAQGGVKLTSEQILDITCELKTNTDQQVVAVGLDALAGSGGAAIIALFLGHPNGFTQIRAKGRYALLTGVLKD